MVNMKDIVCEKGGLRALFFVSTSEPKSQNSQTHLKIMSFFGIICMWLVAKII